MKAEHENALAVGFEYYCQYSVFFDNDCCDAGYTESTYVVTRDDAKQWCDAVDSRHSYLHSPRAKFGITHILDLVNGECDTYTITTY